MGKVLIPYRSASGHAAKMAELGTEGARSTSGVEVRLRDVDSASAEDVS